MQVDPSGGWEPQAESLHREIMQPFVGERNGQAMFAYAIDGETRYHWYHDANDLPMALAPAWGLCRADDPIWRATMDFAFSEANSGGCYEGRLGSVHTRAPWSLGDIQDWLIARLTGDSARAEHAQQHLHEAAQFDGALPEGYDLATKRVISRYWFAWPNAAYACLALGAFDT